VEDRPGHDRRYAIDAAKARHELGWKPAFDFPTALRQTIAWYLEHEAWRLAIAAEGDVRSRQGLSGEPRKAPASAAGGIDR
jgi:dTDP-glucose 4,6-dehydratase